MSQPGMEFLKQDIYNLGSEKDGSFNPSANTQSSSERLINSVITTAIVLLVTLNCYLGNDLRP